MIKKRFGDDFVNSITANLEVKTQEAVKRDAKGKGRKPRGEYKGDRKPRENKGEKKEEKVEEGVKEEKKE